MSKLELIYAEIELMRKHFGWDESDTIEYLVSAILEEAHELQQAYTQADTSEMSKELADIFMLALTLVKKMDLDLLEIISSKRQEVMTRHYD